VRHSEELGAPRRPPFADVRATCPEAILRGGAETSRAALERVMGELGGSAFPVVLLGLGGPGLDLPLQAAPEN
jgi:hypothetical protein